jgi:tripartite ATP-independent transporter DctM subunit
MSETGIGIVGIFALLALFSSGIEIGFAMAVIGALGFTYLVSFSAAMNMMAKDFFEVFSNYHLTVVPLFMFMGQLAFSSGMAGKIYDCAHKFIGHLPGGLAMATVGGATLFKAICGSSPATSATFASTAVPEMDRYGYDKKLSTGIVATVGTLGFLIPPSAGLILLGIITEQSIGKLFMAGLIPGLILAVFFVFTIYIWCKLNPSIGPRGKIFSWKERVSSVPEAVWPIIIFAIIIGGLMSGFFTPTEAGSVGTFAVLILVLVRKQLNFEAFKKAVADSIRPTAMILMLVAGSTVLGHFLAMTQIPTAVSDWVTTLGLPPWIIMTMIMFIYLLGGSFVDDLAFMFLATPIFYPAVMKLGYDPIWFCILIGLTLGVGVVIPPVAICVFIVKNITKVPFSTIYKGVYPFLVALVAVGILLFLFPQLALYLPSILYKS